MKQAGWDPCDRPYAIIHTQGRGKVHAAFHRLGAVGRNGRSAMPWLWIPACAGMTGWGREARRIKIAGTDFRLAARPHRFRGRRRAHLRLHRGLRGIGVQQALQGQYRLLQPVFGADGLGGLAGGGGVAGLV